MVSWLRNSDGHPCGSIPQVQFLELLLQGIVEYSASLQLVTSIIHGTLVARDSRILCKPTTCSSHIMFCGL
jgi:hypothetical protein